MKRQAPVIVIQTSSQQIVVDQPVKKVKRNQNQNEMRQKLKQLQVKIKKEKLLKKTSENVQNIQKVQQENKEFNQDKGIDNDKGQESFIRFQKLKQKQVPNEKGARNRITPWLTKNTKQIQDPLLRFHNQIVDFYNYIKPSQKEHEYKLSVFQVVRYLINQRFPQAEVIPFGSFVTKLYLPDGDIDVAIKIQAPEAGIRSVYDGIYRVIKKHEGLIFHQIQYIKNAKVPLIKFIHVQSQIQFDISVNKLDGVQQIKYVNKMDQIYPEFKYMVFVFKTMLRIRQMQQTYTGGVGSFLLFCMILHYLRYTHKKQKYLTLAQHVLKFMEFYGINGDWERKSIMVDTGDQVGRGRQQHTLSFYSPQDRQHDIGKSAYKIRDVFNVFKNRYRVMMGTNFKARSSILKELVNPSDQQFKYYKYQKKQKQLKNKA